MEWEFAALTDVWTCDFGDATGQHSWIIGKEYGMSLSDEGMFTITSEAGSSTVSVDIVNIDMIKDLSGIDISEYIAESRQEGMK